MEKKQEENLQTNMVEVGSFFCAKIIVLVKSTSFETALNFVLRLLRLCSISTFVLNLEEPNNRIKVTS